MILLRLMGGLGNQMFQYAFGKSLSLKYNVELKLDLALLGDEYINNDSVIRSFDLDVFKLPDLKFASQVEVVKFNGKINPDFVDRLIYKLRRTGGRYPVLVQKNQECDLAKVYSFGSNVCLVGKWQSEEFFKENSEEIKRIFSFKDYLPNEYSQKIAVGMKDYVTVGVQVRRGDYVSHPVYSRGLGAIDASYYFDAIDLIKQKVEDSGNLKFYFFSDDINWCKDRFKGISNAFFVDQEKTSKGYISDLWLLQQCNHSIISNSTFAWWGAWLSEKDGSIIIAPKNWARQKEFIPQNVVPNRWTKLDNKFEPVME